MRITKGAAADKGSGVSAEDLRRINQFTKKELKEEDVFVFDLILCDNAVDRDFERFSLETLKGLEKLFVGKTGIFDHTWSAKGQKSRIFKTEIVAEEGSAGDSGEPYSTLRARAYMLRSDANAELIDEIEGGIKREVSIGCSVKNSVCSICGEGADSPKCGHVKGREYNGRICYMQLENPTDAYEWSFVAVPAQKNAGVVKKLEMPEGYVRGRGDAQNDSELERLKKNAQIGERYLASLRKEVVRLGAIAQFGFDEETLSAAADKLDEHELLGFKKAFEKKIDEFFPPECQLAHERDFSTEFGGEEFLI